MLCVCTMSISQSLTFWVKLISLVFTKSVIMDNQSRNFKQNQIQELVNHINRIVDMSDLKEWQTNDKEVTIKDVTLFDKCHETKTDPHQHLSIATCET